MRDYIDGMKAVGVRDLKAHLSSYLRDVAAGEVVLVTDRGRVVAELRTPGQEPDPRESETARRLRRMVERYPLRVGEPRDPSVYRASPVRTASGTGRDLLDADRDESGRLR
jgi:antitoxin (DNA-binding transcriptional repressor) of toxin-antitoxin stability system